MSIYIRVIFVLLSYLLLSRTSTAQQYTFTEIPTLGTKTEAYSVNDLGVVVGKSTNPLGQHRAFIYYYNTGSIADLGTLGGSEAAAESVNNQGIVVGYSYLPGDSQFHACLWSSGSVLDISWPQQNASSGQALGVNNNGLVVGYTTREVNAYMHGFSYLAGIFSDLGTLNQGGAPPGSIAVGSSTARDVNSNGQIVGSSTGIPYIRSNPQHAFISQLGNMVDLGALGPAFNWSDAYGVNDSGIAVGASGNLPSYPRAVKFTGGTVVDLGLGPNSIANDINNSNQIVGVFYQVVNEEHAFLVTPTGGLVDLHSFLPPDWLSSVATSINQNGWIVGHGVKQDGSRRSWLLIPST